MTAPGATLQACRLARISPFSCPMRRLRLSLIELFRSHNQADDRNTRVDAEYLEVIASRS